jgi:hypothetical protein
MRTVAGSAKWELNHSSEIEKINLVNRLLSLRFSDFLIETFGVG